ncbi:sugar-transfer associated ATP-grasp domain-containing protein [Acinetobacter radioresistens]|uniref:Alpha-L-glutamate ligase-related protein ATP-grasp domain-containing protein n=1 Tax=Acinetobacter radioresistens TaxID=40216 RepID=A0A8H2K1H7_ACIRA|nr:sugar-transfer associated ATP-grasp domain-containing protein [Acinetobacter radioresistens]TNX86273.1 hypothetical protein FHY67_12750 [Acinetobacter radioresistens]
MNLVKSTIIKFWNFLSVYRGYYIRHKNIYKNKLILKKLTKKEKSVYINYWSKLSPIISMKTVEISKSLSGRFDKRIVPEEFFSLYFEPVFNKDKNVGYLQNKSIYNKWFDKGLFPKDYFHKINDIYYDSNFEIIENIENYIAKELTGNLIYPLVVKPNRDSYGGADVSFVNDLNSLISLIKDYKNLVVQEKIVQSELLNKFNADSINTVRVCLYRDKSGCIHILNTSLRMGKDGSLDNETAGGIVCNIKKNGILNEYAVDKYANKYTQHPNSNYIFKDSKFPFYSELKERSLIVANKIIGVNLISLDMALDSQNHWRCIEVNLFGQTIRFAQYAGEPFFSDITDQVINDLLTKIEEIT